MKDQIIQIRISKTDKEILTSVAEKLDVSISHVLRRAIRESISLFITDLKTVVANAENQNETALAK